jgi:urease accessory protein
LQGGVCEVTFRRDPDGGTYIGHQRQTYPFHICRPFAVAEDPAGMATLYIQSVAGGVFGDSRLQEAFAVEEGAAAHVTTQASTIVHSMAEGVATQSVHLRAGAGALLEYMPDPLILFPNSRLQSCLRIECRETATVIAGDSFLFHDPGEQGAIFDWLDATVEVTDPGGMVVARDRTRLTGAMAAANLPGVTGPYHVQGSLYVVSRAAPTAGLVDALRAVTVADVERAYVGASELPAGCGAWLRVLADDAVTARGILMEAWARVRQLLTGRRPLPRHK